MIEGTLAECYLKNQGLENINVKSVQFHPAVWEKETQTYMPALVAKAVGQSANSLETKGIQVTYLNNETGNKAALEYPVRYSGSSDAIIMLQKPSQSDHRWFLAVDIETGLAITKANPNIRVATLATQEKFDKNPLKGQGVKELILCANKSTPNAVIDRAVVTFTEKQFIVRIAKPEKEITFNDTFKAQGSAGVCHQLEKAEKVNLHHVDIEIKSVATHFERLENELCKAKNQPYAVHSVRANEAIEKYANDLNKNPNLLSKIKISLPDLGKRIATILEKDQGIEL